MSRLTNTLHLIILTLLITSCQTDKYDTSDISGTWYLIFQDSTYGEVIFTKNRLWEYSENAGTYTKTFVIENDTFNIDDIQFKAKLIRKNKDQFDLVSKTFTTHYFRLKTQLDTAGLINGNEDTLDKYVKEWRERKYNWETDFKKQKE